MAETPEERLGRLEERMDRVEEGVSNFRQFQTKGLDFFSRSDERAITEQQFHNKRDQEIKDALMAHNSRQTFMLGLLMFVVAALGLLLALPPAIKALHDTGIHFPKIFTLSEPQQAYNSQQEAHE